VANGGVRLRFFSVVPAFGPDGVVRLVNDRDADEPLLEPGINVHKLMRMSFTNLAARVKRILAFLVNRFCFCFAA
jgi:hypothetical protein